jgi:hypothetical protein
MIITEEKEQLHYINKLMKEKHRHIYRMRPDGLLEYDGDCMTQRFLAYIDGKWYGSQEWQQGASEGALEEIEKRKFLFGITESRYWQMREDKKVEYAFHSKPLSEETVMVFVAVQNENICLHIIDGSKNKLPLMLGVPREPDSEKIFVQTVIAMTRQYDPDAAKEMEEFWFKKQDLRSNRENADAAYWDPVLDPQLIEADSVFWNQ